MSLVTLGLEPEVHDSSLAEIFPHGMNLLRLQITLRHNFRSSSRDCVFRVTRSNEVKSKRLSSRYHLIAEHLVAG